MVDNGSRANELIELAQGLHHALCQLFSILRYRDPNSTATGDLTLAQLSILATLLQRGPIRITELALHEGVQPPTITVTIRRLEKTGLVQRSRDETDLRAVLVEITPRGRAVRSESLGNRCAALAAMLHQLPVADLAILTEALGSLERLAHG